MAKKKSLPHKQELILQLAVEGLIKGYPSSELVVELKRAYPETNDEEAERLIRQALAFIKDRTLIEIDRIIPRHVEIYEQIFKEYADLRYVPGKLKAMRAKERLLGLLKETNYVEVHNEVNLTLEQEPQYDLSKLEQTEIKRLEELMERTVRQ